MSLRRGGALRRSCAIRASAIRACAVFAVIVTAAGLAACTSTTRVVKRSSAVVAISSPFTSYNPAATNPAATADATSVNQQVSYATNSAFEYYDGNSKLVADTSFGTVQQLNDSPLKVRYTINPGVTWSDGVKLDRADLLLAWAASSGALNTAGFDARPYVNTNGTYKGNFPKDAVWFDGSTTNDLRNAPTLPTMGSNGRSITLTYDQFFVDWRTAFEVGVPAHLVAERAFGTSSATKADAELVAAITTNDIPVLARVSRIWNTAFTVRHGKLDTSFLVGDGPYTVTAIDADGSVTLTANKRYVGAHKPRIETITARLISNSTDQVAALTKGTVDVITPTATAATAKSLVNLDNITIASGYDAGFEHLDLQLAHSKSGNFDKLKVRQAFLKVVPRTKIVARVASGLQEESSPRSSFMLFPGTSAYAAAIADNGSSAYAAVDVIGARALLRAAGVRHPTVCILYDPANPVRVAEYGLIKASADRAGFRVTDCSTTAWQSELGRKGAYDASLFSWRSTGSAVTAPTARLHSDATAENYNFYANSDTDKLLDTLSRTTDEASQSAVLTEIDRQLFSTGYGLPLFQQPSLTAFRTTVSGIRRSPFAPGVFWNIWEWRPTR
jgi:peptide/nickel transport system substrate-binding protein